MEDHPASPAAIEPAAKSARIPWNNGKLVGAKPTLRPSHDWSIRTNVNRHASLMRWTAPVKYTKEAMSRWAEAYEREHGVHCEQRIKNNEERDRIRAEKKTAPKSRKNPRPREEIQDQERRADS